MDQAIFLLLRRGIRRGLKTLLRERDYGAGLCALLCVATLAQLLVVGALTIRGVQEMLRAQTDLRLEIQSGVSEQSVREFSNFLSELPEVSETILITRQKAYELERTRDPELIRFLEEFGIENPFPDAIAVTLRSLGDYERFATIIRDERWSAIIDPAFLSQVTNQETEIHEMLKFTRAGEMLFAVLLVCVSAAILALLVSVVSHRVVSRSEEVLIEELSGAGAIGILLPFVTEAVVLLAGSLIGSMLGVAAFLQLLPWAVPGLSGPLFGALREALGPSLRVFLPLILLGELLLTPLLALLGTWIPMRRYVRGGELRMA